MNFVRTVCGEIVPAGMTEAPWQEFFVGTPDDTYSFNAKP